MALTKYDCAVSAVSETTREVEPTEYVGPSLDLNMYSVIPFPPSAGAPQETESWFICGVADGAEGVLGTVVAVTAEDAAEAGDVPY